MQANQNQVNLLNSSKSIGFNEVKVIERMKYDEGDELGSFAGRAHAAHDSILPAKSTP